MPYRTTVTIRYTDSSRRLTKTFDSSSDPDADMLTFYEREMLRLWQEQGHTIRDIAIDVKTAKTGR